jgi:predicted DNA-binding protein YlxM (UPF0122 family)
MDPLAKSIRLIALYDMYQALLTDKQRSYFEQYYFDDLSITEISENQEVSRNAVFDLLKRTVAKLHDYETKLGLFAATRRQTELIDQLTDHVDEDGLVLLDELRKAV